MFKYFIAFYFIYLLYFFTGNSAKAEVAAYDFQSDEGCPALFIDIKRITFERAALDQKMEIARFHNRKLSDKELARSKAITGEWIELNRLYKEHCY